MNENTETREIGISRSYMFHYTKPVPGKAYKVQACGKAFNQAGTCRPVDEAYIAQWEKLNKWCKKCFG